MRQVQNPAILFSHSVHWNIGWEGLLAAGVFVWIVWALCFPRFCSVRHGPGLVLRLAAFGLAIALPWAALARLRGTPRQYDFGGPEIGMVVGIWMLLYAGIPLVVRLYQKWIQGNLTPEEAAPGRVGIRAWLRVSNLVMAAFLAIGGWLGYDWSLLGTALVVMLALVAYPTVAMVTQPRPAATPLPDESVAQKDQVLRMLDEGKITATEGADLLNALGQSHALTSGPGPHRSRLQQIALLGVVLIVIGFFLPWFSINPGREAARAFSEMRSMVGYLPAFPNNISTPSIGTLHIAGGQIDNGMGWLVLVAGVAAVVVPLLQLKLDSRTQRLIAWTALGIGGFLLLYLLTQAFRFVSVGILIVLAGYVLEALAMAREQSA